MKLAILYAGQGSQHPGMGKDLYEAYPAFRAAFDAAALDFDLHSVCFEDPDGVLNQTEYTQPCMVAFAAGVTAVLQENGVKADYLAGLSLGEYSALQAAGVFTAKQAVELPGSAGHRRRESRCGKGCRAGKSRRCPPLHPPQGQRPVPHPADGPGRRCTGQALCH